MKQQLSSHKIGKIILELRKQQKTLENPEEIQKLEDEITILRRSIIENFDENIKKSRPAFRFTKK